MPHTQLSTTTNTPLRAIERNIAAIASAVAPKRDGLFAGMLLGSLGSTRLKASS